MANAKTPEKECKTVTIYSSCVGEVTIKKDGENLLIEDKESKDSASIFEKNSPYIIRLIKEQFSDILDEGDAEITWGPMKVQITQLCIFEEDITALVIYSNGKKISESLYNYDGELQISDGILPNTSVPSMSEQFLSSVEEAIEWLIYD